MNTILEDNEENIWIGGMLGLTKIVNGEVEKVYSFADGIVNPVSCLFQDKKGVIWIGTEGGLGKLVDGKIKFYRMADGMNHSKITSITEDDMGSLSSNFVSCMIKGPRGDIFIGTKKGITKYDLSSNETTIFNCKNSKISSDSINMMIFDEDNQLWVGTDKGLDRIIFNPPQITRKTMEHISEIKHFGRTDGIVGGEINRNSACKDANGNIWFGSNRGAIKLNIKVDQVNKYIPQTYITKIKIDNKEIDWETKNYRVRPWSGLPENLVLPYNESTVAFEFIGVNHEAPEKINYYWQLEGYEDKKDIPKSTNKASYPKLPPGKYTFKVYACNQDELCGENHTATFSFVVSPPILGRAVVYN